MEVFEAEEAVIIAGDDDIDFNFWEVTEFDFVEIIFIDRQILIMKVKHFL